MRSFTYLAACAAVTLVAGCGSGSDRPPAVTIPTVTMKVLSGSSEYVSGGDSRNEVSAPSAEHAQARILAMHNVHQSFAVRKRMIQKMGHSDHLVIWFTDTMPGVPKASQSLEALALMDEWMANIRANPTRTIAQNRPAKAVDSCFDIYGKQDSRLRYTRSVTSYNVYYVKLSKHLFNPSLTHISLPQPAPLPAPTAPPSI